MSKRTRLLAENARLRAEIRAQDERHTKSLIRHIDSEQEWLMRCVRLLEHTRSNPA